MLTADTLRELARAADYMAWHSEPADRGGRCSAYLSRAADAARAAAAAADPATPAGVAEMYAELDGCTDPAARRVLTLALAAREA